MASRYAALWFPRLLTDRLTIRRPELKAVPFVLAGAERGRMLVKAANAAVLKAGVTSGMVVADARAILPGLLVIPDKPGMDVKLLKGLAAYCLRYTPVAAVDPPDGLMLDISGCAHLWGGEGPYLKDIVMRLRKAGYQVRMAIADTAGTAWAVSRYGQTTPIISPGEELEALMPLPPAALRLEPAILQRMDKLGLTRIQQFIRMPRSNLRRRFGEPMLARLGQALGVEKEPITPIQPVPPYQERLPCLEPVRTATAIEIALHRLLETLCRRLEKEGKGLRKGLLNAYRVDGNIQQIAIGTSKPSRNVGHLYKLFALRIATIRPGLGLELFVLEAPVVEDLSAEQEMIWNASGTKESTALAELLDRIAGKVGMDAIHRYLPREHHWPERSITLAASLEEKPQTEWQTEYPRPLHLLPQPKPIQVMVTLPDYPPKSFQYQGKGHTVTKADGPERIEREWWMDDGQQRDYYTVEDESGARYWLFRLGHYHEGEPEWYLHGFFA